ncbi:Friend virus susceptibility protein 1-like [Xenopus laevis]|uniref:Friend virus susceptibility protein 1-like n=1 Tax=Xenopus laevis TaxID=8355 RepID=A0A8J1LPH4_XENLA|nr:Friend virus susceptibility protein 1-like [Xenopus laevis]
MFKRKNNSIVGKAVNIVDIPGWDDTSCKIIATEWSKGAGLCEDWVHQLKDASPINVVTCLEKVPFEKGQDLCALGRRGWILLSAYRKQQSDCSELKARISQLEKEIIDLQSRVTVLQCQNRLLMDKADTYQQVAETAAVRCAKYKYRKRKGKINMKKVSKLIAKAGVNWDPDEWDGNIWDTSDESEDDRETLCENRQQYSNEFHAVAKPIERRKAVNAPGGVVNTTTLEDFTQQEVTDLHDRFKQSSSEPLISWLVRLYEGGAAGVNLDNGDSRKFCLLSNEATVQDEFRNFQDANMSSMLALAARGASRRYQMESDWPANDKFWYTLRDCVQRIKEEGMKTAVFVGQADQVLDTPLTVQIRNKMIKLAPPAYKNVIMTLLVNETGQPLQHVIESIRELGDLGDWGPTDKYKDRDNKKDNNQKGNFGDRFPRRDMFNALMRDGVPIDEIDGIDTLEMWKLYKKRGLHKNQNKSVGKQDKEDVTTSTGLKTKELSEESKAIYLWADLSQAQRFKSD